MFDKLVELLGVALGTGLLGHWLASRKDKRLDAQALIDQIQEERNLMSERLKENDKKIEKLHNEVGDLRKQMNDYMHDNRLLRWKLENSELSNEQLTQENRELKEELKEVRKENESLEKQNNDLIDVLEKMEGV